ncbi:MAG: Uma2 family endonuclease [Armatimonadota bacterium]
MTVAAKKVWTDEELMRIKHEGKVELVDGEVILMTPAGLEQGGICANLLTRLNNHVRKHKLGRIFDSQTGFRPYENMRAPDISFVSKERLPEGRLPKGFGHFAPDLVVEVFGPNESLSDYEEKVSEYLSWGVRLIWLVDPNTRTVTVVRSNGERQVLGEKDVLSGEDVVPGFKIRVKKIFE